MIHMTSFTLNMLNIMKNTDFKNRINLALLCTHDHDILSFLSTVKFNLLLFCQGL